VDFNMSGERNICNPTPRLQEHFNSLVWFRNRADG
jgi:hypothetical protein